MAVRLLGGEAHAFSQRREQVNSNMDLQKQLRRKYIEEVVKEWMKRNPDIYEDWKRHATFMRKTKVNVWGAEAKGEMHQRFRHLCTVPRDLWNILDRNLDNPRFCEELEEAAWFAKTFKKLAPHDKT